MSCPPVARERCCTALRGPVWSAVAAVCSGKQTSSLVELCGEEAVFEASRRRAP